MQHYRTAKTLHEEILYKGAAQQGRSAYTILEPIS
jgi:hypothetical protein